MSSLALVLCAMVLSSCASDPEKAKREAFDKGRSLFKRGDYEAASLEFRKAIQRDPKFGEAYLQLGLTQVRQQDMEAADRSFTQAVELMPQSNEAKAQLADLYITSYLADPRKPTSLYNVAVKLAGEILQSDPNSFDGLRLRGYIAVADNTPAPAAEYFAKANRLRPDQPDVAALLVENLFETGEDEQAETFARRFISTDRTYGPIYDLLYGYLMQTKRTADAESLLALKVANNPNSSLFATQLASHYLHAGKRELMVTTLSSVASDHTRFPDGLLDVGEFYSSQGDSEEAIHYFEEGVRAQPARRIEYQKRLSRVLLAAGKVTDAEKVLGQILADHPRDEQALTVRATIRSGRGTPRDLELAVTDLKTALEQAPKNADNIYQLGHIYELQGKEELAKTQYKSAVAIQKDHLPSLQALAHFYLLRQQFQEAREFADRVLQWNPADPIAHLVRTAALAAASDYDQARQELTGLIQQYPRLEEAHIQLAMLDLEQKRYANAELRFRERYRPGSEDIRALKGLVEVWGARNQWDKALAAIQQDLKKVPKSTSLRQLLAETAVRAGNFPLAIEEYGKLEQSGPLSRDSTLTLGLALQAAGKLDLAIPRFQKAQQANPKDSLAPALLGKAYQDAGNLKQAIVAYRESLLLESRNSSVQNNLAFALAESGGDLTEALRLSSQAAQGNPSNLDYSDTLGWIYLKQKQFSSAIRIFQNISSKDPSVVSYRLHLSEALLKSGASSEARATLRAAEKLTASSSEKQEIARLSSLTGN